MRRSSSFLLVLASTSFIATSAIAQTPQWQRVSGLKYPNSIDEGSEPVRTSALWPTGPLGGFSELVPFVLSAPDQDEAGSCLYMADTGIAEWWLARLAASRSDETPAAVDLSERYLMNVADRPEWGGSIDDWRTDTILNFNHRHQSVLNADYRFTMGWYATDGNGSTVKSAEGQPGASYGTSYNWIDDLDTIKTGFVTLPTFSRRVLFADAHHDQWAVGVAPKDIVTQVQNALITAKAPVQVIYNHHGYWHAVFIVGFDTEMDSDKCGFVENSRLYYPKAAAQLQKDLDQTTDAAAQTSLKVRINRLKSASEHLEKAYADGGGCRGKGMFYVRDSIYPANDMPLYDYDLSKSGEEIAYNRPVILREFEWLTYLGNHMVLVEAK